MRLVSFVILLLLFHIETLGDPHLFRFIPFVLISVLFPKYFSFKVVVSFFQKNVHFFWLFAIIIIGMFRSNYGGAENASASTLILKVLYFFLFCSLIICIANHQMEKEGLDIYKSLYHLLLLPTVLYFSINILFYFLDINFRQSGLVDDNIDEAVLLSNFGISINRVRFPFATSFNNYSFNIALVLIVVLFFLFIKKRRDLFLIFSSIICFAKLLMTDTRIAILLPIVLLMLAYFTPKTLNKYGKFLFLLLFFLGPILFINVIPAISEALGLDAIARGEDDIKTGNTRVFIWGISLIFFMNFEFLHLFGFGEYGHFGSGQSLKWSVDFVNYENAEYNATSHNSLFTIVYDYGYLGLTIYLLFFFAIFSMAKKYKRSDEKISLLIFAIMLFIAWAGITESLVGFYFENFMFMFLTAMIVLSIQVNKKPLNVVASKHSLS